MRDSMVNKKEPVLVAQTLLWWGCNFAKPQLHHTVYQIVWGFSIQSIQKHSGLFKSLSL